MHKTKTGTQLSRLNSPDVISFSVFKTGEKKENNSDFLTEPGIGQSDISKIHQLSGSMAIFSFAKEEFLTVHVDFGKKQVLQIDSAPCS